MESEQVSSSVKVVVYKTRRRKLINCLNLVQELTGPQRVAFLRQSPQNHRPSIKDLNRALNLWKEWMKSKTAAIKRCFKMIDVKTLISECHLEIEEIMMQYQKRKESSLILKQHMLQLSLLRISKWKVDSLLQPRRFLGSMDQETLKLRTKS